MAYRVTTENGMVIECGTAEEARALIGENAFSTIATTHTRSKKQKQAPKDLTKQAMGSGPKRKWALARWYADKKKMELNDAWLTLGKLKKEEPVQYAKLAKEFDDAQVGKSKPKARSR